MFATLVNKKKLNIADHHLFYGPFIVYRMSLLLWMAFTKFELLPSPSFSFAKMHILSILFLAAQRGPRKFPASSAVPVLALPSSYLKVPIF